MSIVRPRLLCGGLAWLVLSAAPAAGEEPAGPSSEQRAQESELGVRLRMREGALLHRRLPVRPLTRLDPRSGGLTASAIQLAGRLTLVHIWSLSCAPCVDELPMLLRLFAHLRQQQRALSILLLAEDEPGQLIPYAATHLAGHPELELAVLSADSGWREQLGDRSLPATLLVDGELIVRQALLGSLRGRRNELLSALARFIRLRAN